MKITLTALTTDGDGFTMKAEDPRVVEMRRPVDAEREMLKTMVVNATHEAEAKAKKLATLFIEIER